MVTEIGHVPSRIRAIEARASQIARIAAGDSRSGARQAGAPLGFGLALQNALADASAVAGPQIATTAGLMPGTLSGEGASSQFTPGGLPSGATPATAPAGGYGRLEPPAELVSYGNGRVPPAALEPVGDTGHRLYEPAAHALILLIADAEASGVTIGITDSYRPLAVQERLAEEKGLYSQGGLAAVPGTSNHGWGVATDLRLDEAALAWMRDNAWRFGYVEDVPREPWHWTYRPDAG